jgi:transposase
MPALAIRGDMSSEELRRQARRESDGRVSARLIAIANALEGMDRASAARLAGMDRQTLRDWVHRYNAEGIAGLCNRPAPGRRPKLTEGQMAALKAVVLTGPDPAVDKIARWRIVDLCQWVEERWGVSYSETGMLRVLWALDLIAPEDATASPTEQREGPTSLQKDPMGDGRSSSSRVRRPTSYPGDRQWRSRLAPCRPSPPSVLRCLSLWN